MLKLQTQKNTTLPMSTNPDWRGNCLARVKKTNPSLGGGVREGRGREKGEGRREKGEGRRGSLFWICVVGCVCTSKDDF